MKRNAFGQLISTNPYVRFFAPKEGEGGGGGGGEFKAPASQEELDRIVTDRVSRAERKAREDERAKLADYDDLKKDAEAFRAAKAAEDAKNKPKDGDKPAGVTETDVDKRINDALAAERLELAKERAGDALDKALEGRSFTASKVLNLDLTQFVAEDGKSVDKAKLDAWVKENTAEALVTETKRRRLPGQGERDGNAKGGSVSAGRDLYDENHPKKSSGKD
ncbi:hypothetical protein [Microbacterium sp.]|uniref:hypothetical protein n=1 Tax=Microbacterium sp. TaxID=51671 RepID=UPI0039E3BE0B